ncbi:hypothetical protein BC793_101699 [Actinoplanes xinjiangensis]|uniref:Uncharacterized protein n=1 Tax=Actinoplanes xinjiangensis TaxID=512350 RepID=A0A316FYR8_9ACTN|nr:hypothetical protein BC793_101699 [Actinoplanes xinjiangensis]
MARTVSSGHPSCLSSVAGVSSGRRVWSSGRPGWSAGRRCMWSRRQCRLLSAVGACQRRGAVCAVVDAVRGGRLVGVQFGGRLPEARRAKVTSAHDGGLCALVPVMTWTSAHDPRIVRFYRRDSADQRTRSPIVCADQREGLRPPAPTRRPPGQQWLRVVGGVGGLVRRGGGLASRRPWGLRGPESRYRRGGRLASNDYGGWVARAGWRDAAAAWPATTTEGGWRGRAGATRRPPGQQQLRRVGGVGGLVRRGGGLASSDCGACAALATRIDAAGRLAASGELPVSRSAARTTILSSSAMTV